MNRTVLYIAWNSVEEPLVHSQVLAYLKGLAGRNWRFVLVTLEAGRSRQWLLEQNQRLVAALADTPAAGKLVWQPVQVPAALARLGTAGRLWRAMVHLESLLRRQPVALIHARSYLPAWLAMRLAARHGLPWLFDARGFWVDEKADKGSLAVDSWLYRRLKAVEEKLYRQSQAVVMLAESGAKTLRRWLSPHIPVRIIPTCVDTERFRPALQTSPRQRLLCVGSVGPGYLGREVSRAFAVMQRDYPGWDCELCTRSDPHRISQLAQAEGVDLRRVRVFSRSHERMPDLLAAGGIGLSLIEPTISKRASCPTKVGEYLACGMPVIYNPGIGDMDAVLGDGQLAVRCDDLSTAGLARAIQQAVALFKDPATANRCRRLAENYFSLDKGVAAYDDLYREMLASHAEAGANRP